MSWRYVEQELSTVTVKLSVHLRWGTPSKESLMRIETTFLRKYFMSQGIERIIQKLTRAKLRGEAKPMAPGKKKEDL
jgi:phage tail sheath gpL-like